MRGGGPGLRAARMLSAADLQLLILSLLEERPRHGYELIKAFQELTAGAYVPSPGMIYPALSYLEELGQATIEQDGSKKQYRIAAPGLEALNDNRARVAALFESLKNIGQRLERARAAYEQSGGTSAPAAAPGPLALEAARRDLKAALFDALDASPDEQQRVAEILQRTVAEIRKR